MHATQSSYVLKGNFNSKALISTPFSYIIFAIKTARPLKKQKNQLFLVIRQNARVKIWKCSIVIDVFSC